MEVRQDKSLKRVPGYQALKTTYAVPSGVKRIKEKGNMRYGGIWITREDRTLPAKWEKLNEASTLQDEKGGEGGEKKGSRPARKMLLSRRVPKRK